MHLRHIDPRSLEWKDAMLDETKPGFELDTEQLEAATDADGGRGVDAPTTSPPSMGLSAPSHRS